MTLKNKNIIVGITGSIAAYKSVELIRRLREQQTHVQVVMTQSAQHFITPLTLQAVSDNRVHDHLFSAEAEFSMGHIELARWADLILVAPATADIIAKLAHGIADDLLTTLCLVTTAPIAIAPAMNKNMWQHWATQENVAKLQQHDIKILGPGHGSQACGDIGFGTLIEPTEIINLLVDIK